MIKKNLCIVLTDKCTACCQICSFRCKPENNHVMDEDLMKDIILQAHKNTNIKEICFSGGEVFLYYDLLKKGVNDAKKLGFRTSVITNGFWGELQKATIFSMLSELRLDKMYINTDYYHSKFISIDIIRQAIFAVQSFEMDLEVGIGETKSGSSSAEYFRNLGIQKYFLKFHFYPFIQVGRAEEMPEEDFYRFKETKNLRCPLNSWISIRFDGEVFPCCSPAVFDTTLSMGNLKEKSLVELLADEDNIAINKVLMSERLDRIVATARNLFHIEIPKDCVNTCEICHILFKDKLLSHQLKPYTTEVIDTTVEINL